MIKNIIFDWSGVIIDNTNNVYLAVMGFWHRFGLEPITFEQFRQEFKLPVMDFHDKYLLSKVSFEEQKDIFTEEYAKLQKAGPYNYIVDLLGRLKEIGFKMAVISSDPAVHLRQAMNDYGMDDIFIDIKTDLHNKKEALAEVIRNNNFQPEETLFIGDTTHEIEVGKELGIKTAGVTWGIQLEDKLRSANPDFIFHNLEEMEKTILGE